MPTTGPTRRWPARRIAAVLLTAALLALGLYPWRTGGGDTRLYPLLGIGVALGLLYTARGGSLPRFVHRISHSHWAGGTGINTDDDPSNLSPKLYLPILLAVMTMAALLCYFCIPKR